jgi:hypothetical protein
LFQQTEISHVASARKTSQSTDFLPGLRFLRTPNSFFSAMGKLLHASIKPKVVYERRLDGRQLDARRRKKRKRTFLRWQKARSGACEYAIFMAHTFDFVRIRGTTRRWKARTIFTLLFRYVVAQKTQTEWYAVRGVVRSPLGYSIDFNGSRKVQVFAGF